ncbi:MAG: aldo/keto reductase [Anaeroplasmataceae bacterium]
MIKLKKYFTLYNNITIPSIGFGTWQTKDGSEAYDSVLWAIEAGYRHIDTALIYGNEVSIGKAIKDSNVKRSELFITTKCPADIKSYDGCMKAFNTSLNNLGLDYIDLYLIHAPWPWSDVGGNYTEGNIEVWKAMIELYNKGFIRAIGVSNFHPTDIEALTAATNFKPMVNQIRYFIGNRQDRVTNYCMENDILVEAYSPLATGKILDNPTLKEIASKYNVSIPKLCINYCLHKNTLPLPKSIHKERIIDNLDVDFVISDSDIAILDTIHDESLDRPLRS